MGEATLKEKKTRKNKSSTIPHNTTTQGSRQSTTAGGATDNGDNIT